MTTATLLALAFIKASWWIVAAIAVALPVARRMGGEG